MIKTKLIFDPISGGGIGKEYINDVVEKLKNNKVDLDLYYTKKVGDAREVSKEIKENEFDVVAVMGGDGTINEVINGLFPTNIPITIIPSGVANVFANEVGILRNPLKACEAIYKGNLYEVDLGKINDSYFLSLASIGFDSHVLKDTPSSLKRKYGKLAYIYTGLKTVFSYEPSPIYVTVKENAKKKKCYFMVVGNVSIYGTPYVKMTPKASVNDGLLDVCLFKKENFINYFRYFLGAIFKIHTQFPDVEYFQTDKFYVESEKPLLVEVDGDVWGELPTTFSILKQGLRVLL
ncbi:MAG: diacylglycerol kinase family protein [Candidatus Humimicrobiia bacterium]